MALGDKVREKLKIIYFKKQVQNCTICQEITGATAYARQTLRFHSLGGSTALSCVKRRHV